MTTIKQSIAIAVGVFVGMVSTSIVLTWIDMTLGVTK